ncbi:aldehyde dehydrogenase [Gordonia sp. TBRC 11910]|uniref:aldehyde dehydrogenase (NAD(+)) n=1 Tax=Gordonia asplenii TaxID=2725283 RepID=A0A848KXW4_9ACTN|nr:aldehyde dehydrogenase [Gordonia asplenii]NMO03082.1 aldehyde dehydrogenase [Gordonia asplenii]
MWHDNSSRFYIDGRWRDAATADTFEVRSPFTEEPIAQVAAGSRADVDAAVTAARRAFDSGPWSRMSLDDRAVVVRAFRDHLAANAAALGEVITAEMGCPISQTVPSQSGAAIALLDTNLELAQQYPWKSLRRSALGTALVVRRPIGVVAAVVPWNAPISVAMLKLAPALLAGCSVVLKPSPESPLSAHYLAAAADAAGLPPGVLNIVVADRAESEYLVTHPGVDKVSFTGSTTAGQRIATLCGNDIRRYTLELGGKSAAIILDDADLTAVVASLRSLSFRYNGQACTNKTRILVSHKRHDEVVDALAEMIAGLRLGDPTDASTDIGPLVSPRQRDRVEGYLAKGRAEGARVVIGGGRPAAFERGMFVEPTLFAGVTNDMTIAQEEIFGPVVGVIAVDDEAQAIAVANDSAYGLSGAVYSADSERALRVAAQLETGSVEINGASTGFHAALGGFKHSGVGREAGLEGFDAFVELTSFGLPTDLADTLG